MANNRKGAIIFIFVTILLDAIGLGIIIPVIPEMIQTIGGLALDDAAVIGGFLGSTYALMQFVFSPILGNLSDRYGRRPILLISVLGLGIDHLFTAFAPSIFWLFIARMVSGICGASFSTASAYMADISTPETKAQNFGMIGVAFGLGFIIGPVIGGLLGGYGYTIPFIAAAILSFLNVLYGYFVLPESLSVENRRPFDWRKANPIGSLKLIKEHPIIWGTVLSLFLLYLSGKANEVTWTFITKEKFGWDEATIGYSLGFIGISIAIVQGLLIKRSVETLGQKKTVIIGLICYAFGFFLFALAPTGLLMFVFIFPFTLGGIATPTIQGLVSNGVAANRQGELQGALTSMISITSIIGPYIMTQLFSHFANKETGVYFPGAPFLLASLLCLSSLVIMVYSFKKSPELIQQDA